MSPLTTQNYPAEPVLVSPRRETTVQRAISPNIFTRGGGVILNIGLMDGMVVSKSIADSRPAFPRRRSRSASNSSQPGRDQILQSVSGKVDSTREATYSPGLQVSHSEASGSALRTGAHDPNAPGYLLIPSGANSGKPREPFTVRAAAVAEAAASMAIAAAPVNPRQTFAVQRAQNQRVSQSTADGTALSVGGGATKNIPPNFFINNSSLTAPLMTIVSSKPATPREANSSIKKDPTTVPRELGDVGNTTPNSVQRLHGGLDIVPTNQQRYHCRSCRHFSICPTETYQTTVIYSTHFRFITKSGECVDQRLPITSQSAKDAAAATR